MIIKEILFIEKTNNGDIIMNMELLKKLLNCDISWKDFSSIEKCNSYLIKWKGVIIKVDRNIVKKAIQSCLDDKFTMQDLLDWSNVVRFSDVFSVEENCRECVVSILDRIEESDEEGNALCKNDLLLMLNKLDNNEEW